MSGFPVLVRSIKVTVKIDHLLLVSFHVYTSVSVFKYPLSTRTRSLLCQTRSCSRDLIITGLPLQRPYFQIKHSLNHGQGSFAFFRGKTIQIVTCFSYWFPLSRGHYREVCLPTAPGNCQACSGAVPPQPWLRVHTISIYIICTNQPQHLKW